MSDPPERERNVTLGESDRGSERRAVEVWARPEAFGSLASIASASSGYSLGAILTSTAAFTVVPGATNTAEGGSLTLGEWVHRAGTYDGARFASS